MKKFICLIIACAALGTYAQISPPKHTWTATLKVVNDDGKPVEGANAHIYYLLNKEFSGLTDSGGVFMASHEDGSENIGFYVEKAGYYSSRITYRMGRVYSATVWNPTQTVVLKKIKDPIPMYAKWLNVGLPVFDQPAGFDLTLGDWVAPYGKGNGADIIFTAHREKRSENDSDYQLTVSFPNAGDGIQDFKVPQYYLHSQGSALKSSQEAPADGYQPKWIQTTTRRPGKP
ncbi:MAG TPA: hypothetical protein VFB72_16510, partial [Verrucomicrobiae bacterium]|nr:hypothetical protein [Verrucomicrobiae bacterium]